METFILSCSILCLPIVGLLIWTYINRKHESEKTQLLHKYYEKQITNFGN